MSQEWVVLELSPRSEGEDPAVIEQSIRHAIKGAEVFLPAVVTQIGDDRVVQYLVDGYAFVRKTLPDVAYFRLENTRYVQTVMLAPGSGVGRHRKVATVRETDIENFRSQIRREADQDIAIGDKVLITTGPYRNIETSVIEEIHEQGVVQVFVKLRSKQSIVTIPRSGLRVVERAPTSPYYNRLSALRAWFRVAKPVLMWPGVDLSSVDEKFLSYSRLEQWAIAYRRLFTFVGFHYGAVDPKLLQIQSKFEELTQLSDWLARANRLYTFVASYYQAPEAHLTKIQDKFGELRWLDGVLKRIRTLRRDVEALGKQVSGDEMQVQNLLIDGHNLAFRCLYAPGIGEMADSKGRPTGMIVGFLKSLASLKKRFPEARVYVAWDGSSKRRRQKFGEYKANRPVRADSDSGGFDQLAFLRSLLPSLGIWQAFNPNEEADDVIASLVRGSLSAEVNMVYSTDRDFLQLATDKTSILIPGAGNRHELTYSPKEVQEDYGVEPAKMVQLRAFCGDTSDNIPGVPRVPKKILRALVQAFGSVDGVYGSGLAGLTKAQYERLRASEPQVRINLELMALVDVFLSVQDPDLDADIAIAKLREVGVNPDSFFTVFFGPRANEYISRSFQRT